MITREVKLKLNTRQEKQLNERLNILTGVYNFAVRKIELNAKDRIFFSGNDFQNLLADHGKKLDIPSHTIQGTLKQAYIAWERCFKKLAKKPRLKGFRNKFNSIPFPDPIKPSQGYKISLPGVGKVKYHKQELPQAKIKCGRILKKASGWYLVLTLDCEHKFPVKNSGNAIGIDPGFKSLITLSNGTKIENPKELIKGQERISQALRARDYKLVARLQERQANRRKDRNHKLARKLVEENAIIAYSKDNLKSMAKKAKRDGNKKRKRFGKSVANASLGQLFNVIEYKGKTCGRTIIAVNSKYTTMTCSNCDSVEGPSGLSGLEVRFWVCPKCGTHHDRDINSARNILKIGLGLSLKGVVNG